MKLSVIIIGYNMARELPRTIKSLSASMQIGIAERDYELILVDNGSVAPFDEDALCESAPNLTVYRFEPAAPSPCAAINFGIEQAKGEVVGVCIDGARLASPGLLARALAAAKGKKKPVIGTLAFHLGPDVQVRSVKSGYDQRAEDRLLRDIAWEDDPYRLFSVSVFALSSAKGWFASPTESNALFLRARHWRELGGFDIGFKCPGGGLANLDIWKRACDDPGAEPVILLGEGTFHQLHGGVATNAAESKWNAFHAEYVRLRGNKYERPRKSPCFDGSLDLFHAYSKMK